MIDLASVLYVGCLSFTLASVLSTFISMYSYQRVGSVYIYATYMYVCSFMHYIHMLLHALHTYAPPCRVLHSTNVQAIAGEEVGPNRHGGC